MEHSTKNLLLYIAESLLENMKAAPDVKEHEELVKNLSKIVESLGRYLQNRGGQPGYMKMTKSEFLSSHKILGDESYENYLYKADEIEEEGGFLPE